MIGDRENETNIVSDITDTSWFEKIDFTQEKGAVFFASGVFYYLKREEIKKLIANMAEAFPGSKLVFDATNAKGLKMMLKTWMEASDMADIALYFSLEDEQEILPWSDKIKKVSKKGYITGYRPLDKRYGFLANRLFKWQERKNLAQFIEIDF